MSLYKRILRLAQRHPETRKDLVPLLRAASLSCVTVRGAARKQYLDDVWDMYTTTYRSLGLGVGSPESLLGDYPVWDLCLDSEGAPRVFHLSRVTPYGLKYGLGGSDGTPEGKRLVVADIRERYKRPGVYAELSHRMLEIAKSAGSPVVCAEYAAKVLSKRVEPLEDGISYRRELSGVGEVVKVLVGRPRGVPTTSWGTPQCPTGVLAFGSTVSLDDVTDAAAHFSCLHFDPTA